MYSQCKLKLLAETPGALAPRQCRACGLGPCKFNHKTGIRSDLYRTKALLVHAFQMTQARRNNNSEWPNWLNQAWQMENDRINSLYPLDYPNSNGFDKLVLVTAQNNRIIEWDDWIVKRTENQLDIVTNNIFKFYYEETP